MYLSELMLQGCMLRVHRGGSWLGAGVPVGDIKAAWDTQASLSPTTSFLLSLVLTSGTSPTKLPNAAVVHNDETSVILLKHLECAHSTGLHTAKGS